MKKKTKIMRSLLKTFLPIALAALVSAGMLTAESQDSRMEWFRDAKFGMFIHFGASESGQSEVM